MAIASACEQASKTSVVKLFLFMPKARQEWREALTYSKVAIEMGLQPNVVTMGC